MTKAGPWLALAVPILAWGLSFPSIKAALVEIPPMTLALGRFALAGVALALVAAISGPQPRLTRGNKVALLLSVLTGITLYFLCENHGVKLIPASAASLIIAGIPILTLLAERLFHSRRLGLLGIAASLVSFLGALLLVGLPDGGGTAESLWGYALMVGAALSWVAYLFAMKPLPTDKANLKVTAWQMVLGALSFVPFAWAESTQWHLPSAAGWSHLGFQGLVCSAASFLLYNHAMEKLGLRTASLAVNLIPVVTAVASYFFLGEVLSVWQGLGGILVLGSVVVVGLNQGPSVAVEQRSGRARANPPAPDGDHSP